MAGEDELQIHISNWTMEDYRRFIEWLRTLFTDSTRRVESRNVPVLMPKSSQLPLPENHFLDMRLIVDDENWIRLRFRRSDIYLVAFQRPTDTQWQELQVAEAGREIRNSHILGYNGAYPDNLHTYTFSHERIMAAVVGLSGTTRLDHNAVYPHLFVLVVMISEAIRFFAVLNYLLPYFNTGIQLDSRMIELIKAFGWLCGEVTTCSLDPSHRFDNNNEFNIPTVLEALATIAILMIKIVKHKNKKREKRTIYDGENPGDPCGTIKGDVYDIITGGPCGTIIGDVYGLITGDIEAQARPKVEVFSVRIDNIDGENPGDLYGTITVTDALMCHYIYNRASGDSEKVIPGDNALLTGPLGYISGFDSFTIDVSLKDRDSWSPDDEVSRGQIEWFSYNAANVFDDPISVKVKGENGSATVNYIVFSDAVLATVEITLINGDNEDPADVYGVIQAGNSKFSIFSVLFHRESKKCIDVRPGDRIPLSRSVVAVPYDSSLEVSAHLLDSDTFSADDEIANGTADFPAELSGTFEKSITGKYGEIRVKVTWRD